MSMIEANPKEHLQIVGQSMGNYSNYYLLHSFLLASKCEDTCDFSGKPLRLVSRY